MKIYSIWFIVAVMVAMAGLPTMDFVRRKLQPAYAEGNQQQQHEQHHDKHPALYVDTKYWIRNTEFGQRDNWRNQLKPCTLIERIQINERAVISMGDALDSLSGSLESNIREISLAREGVLLLEEDTMPDQSDPMFVQYLNQSGDCYESPLITFANGQPPLATTEQQRFYFEPHPDDMSWFNPNNWASAINGDEIALYVPESHLIPCSEDVVVFGSRSASLATILEANERAQTLSFKVNFRPSSFSLASKDTNLTLPAGIRVSKLQIGDNFYDQRDFERLIINSDSYNNLLFEVAGEHSALSAQPSGATSENFNNLLESRQPPASSSSSPPTITIDESSIEANSEHDFCLDEAGCLCGNEDLNAMQLICSFNEPLEPQDLPCHDPIQTSGYCNQICATILTIHMDPIKFSERFLGHVLLELMEKDELVKAISENVFTGARRVDHNRYELTVRLAPGDDSSHEEILGQDMIVVQAVSRHLDNAATRSFYGIKSTEIRSSANWKRSNRGRVFWLSLIVLAPLAIFVYVRDDDNQNSDSATSSAQLADSLDYYLRMARSWTSRGDNFGTMTSSERPILDETDSVVEHAGTIDNNLPQIQLVELESKSNFSLVSSVYNNDDDGDDNIEEANSCNSSKVDDIIEHKNKEQSNLV